MNFYNLNKKALKLRQDTFKAFIEKGEAHLGGSFSIIEALIVIYDLLLKKNDKFILSKSHSSFPMCLILRQKGFNTKLTTHLELDEKNGINCTTGSLGHGLPIATGMAFGKKILKQKGKIIVMISDGECQEGTTWESILIATKHKLDNLLIFVDYNQIQALSRLEDALPLNNLTKKFNSFNCDTYEIKNGNSFQSIIQTLKKIKKNSKPKVFILNTIKGKGIKEFEDDPVWHARKITGAELSIGKKRLGIK
jgi:transketolase